MRLTAPFGTMVPEGVKEKGDPMDIESRLQKLESDLDRTKAHVRKVLAVALLLLVLISLGFPESDEWTSSVLDVLVLVAVAHVLVSAVSGLRWLLWGRRAEEARRHDKIMMDLMAVLAKTRDQNHP